MGVFQKGIPSALITGDAAFAGLQAMTASLPGSPSLDTLTVSLQGCGEVGYRVAQHLVECGARLKIAEPRDEICQAFQQEHPKAFASGQVTFLQDPEGIYDEPADIFCPCALRDILTKKNLGRLLRAVVRLIGGPANNVFPDQTEGPWMFHDAGLPVVPYEGIGADGVIGVAYAIMTGVLGSCPFEISEKIEMIRDYVAKVLLWSGRYDLPAQVISDRILFRSALRRRLLGHDHYVQLLEHIRFAMNGPDRDRERGFVNEYTKRGFFYGEGRFGEGAGSYFDVMERT
jgi:leucine dehydrogenase